MWKNKTNILWEVTVGQLLIKKDSLFELSVVLYFPPSFSCSPPPALSASISGIQSDETSLFSHKVPWFTQCMVINSSEPRIVTTEQLGQI